MNNEMSAGHRKEPEVVLEEIKKLASSTILDLNEGHFNAPLLEQVRAKTIPELIKGLQEIMSYTQNVQEVQGIIRSLTELVEKLPPLKSDFTNPFSLVVGLKI